MEMSLMIKKKKSKKKQKIKRKLKIKELKNLLKASRK